MPILSFRRGCIALLEPTGRISFDEVISRRHLIALVSQSDLGLGLDETARYEREAFNFPNGCHICEVEVNLHTGLTQIVKYSVVDDFGRIINPLIVRGQVIGGIVQGIGQALLENTRYDGHSGQLLTASLMDYCLPQGRCSYEHQRRALRRSADRNQSTWSQRLRRSGSYGSPPAVVNAVVDALAEYGIEHLDMPLVPAKVWSLLEASRR